MLLFIWFRVSSQIASTMADVSSNGVKSEIERLEAAKKVAEEEKGMYVKVYIVFILFIYFFYTKTLLYPFKKIRLYSQ